MKYVKIDNVEVEYFVDYVTKHIHLLDLDQARRMSLTNAIDPNFQKKLIEQEELLQDVLDFSWICYPTDGVIYQYVDYGFQFVNDNISILHNPYVEISKGRRKR